MCHSLRFVLAAVTLLSSAATAQTLDRIRDSGTIKVGYRTDAPPISYKPGDKEPTGYSVILCRAVAAQIGEQIGNKDLRIDYVPVTAENRFRMVQDGRIDLLCGATTITLSRREMVDFSLPTFIDGAGVLLRRGGPQSFAELNGKKVGVRKGTTTEEALGNTVKELSINIETIAVKDHREGLAKLLNDDISAYFADRAILLFLMVGSGEADRLFLSPKQFTYEPYGLALRKGDSVFRLAVDRALSRLYRSGAIDDVFRRGFGPNASPTAELKALYRINTLPE